MSQTAHRATATHRETRDVLDARALTTIRLLAADMVETANSGHPGMPLGAAPLAWVLWSRHLSHDPSDPTWPNRDRFVLSAGHGSALQYALLHLFGYDLTLDELRRFRGLGSRTPGHPERGHTPGVETTTGPLGQGLANGVGMALAERMLHARFGPVVDHHTYVVVGDGCLMEGISHEAASLAGRLRLGRLIVLYDDNNVTIDGPATLACQDDTLARFAAYGWHTARVPDGNDLAEIDRALTEAKADERPSLVAVSTVIGFGAPGIEGTPAAHGSPLGPVALPALRERAGWPDKPFFVPDDVRVDAALLATEGRMRHRAWQRAFDRWAAAEPELAAEWRRRHDRDLPEDLDEVLATVATGDPVATRQASGRVLKALGPVLPELVGGAADLAGSTGTSALPGGHVSAHDYTGPTLNFGVREHAMAAVLNGLAAHGGLRPFGATFLVFSDYLRPAIRLSALMKLPVIYLFTHDSVVVGEDGPTHQPVEHIESLRLIPGLAVLRPADGAETVAAWRAALARTDGPTALILSRQTLAAQTGGGLDQLDRRGARIVGTPVGRPAVTLLASGSEVEIARRAAEALNAQSVPTRTVSVPHRERLAALPPAEREELLGTDQASAVFSLEAGVPDGWVALTGSPRRCIGITRFGASGSGQQVLAQLGISVVAVVDQVLAER